MFAYKSAHAATLAILLTAGLAACTTPSACMPGDCNADASITEAVKAQLKTVAILPEDEVTVQTIDHVVYLNGLVDTEREVMDATQLAANVPGVGKVVNKLALSR
jgi:osmotically-inducible protein OsmY